MTHTLMALYNQPQDADSFDRHYEETHAKVALTLPGLRSFTSTRPGPGPDGSPAPYYLVAALTFEDQAALGAAMASPEGQATVEDLTNFAGAGVTILTGADTVYL